MTKFYMLFFSCLVTWNSSGQSIHTGTIDWPAGYEPKESKFFIHNEIEILASPEVVWQILTDALKWPLWYKGAKNVGFPDPSLKRLEKDAAFTWQTMGLRFESKMKEFEPYRLLAWESRKRSIQGYHVWLIVPTEKGCKVITEESQNGWLTFFEKTFQPRKLKNLHDVWLAGLKTKAESQNFTR